MAVQMNLLPFRKRRMAYATNASGKGLRKRSRKSNDGSTIWNPETWQASLEGCIEEKAVLEAGYY